MGVDGRDGTGIDPLEHVTVMAALSRLAVRGTWARVLAGEVPRPDDEASDALDLADVELLVAVGVLGREDRRLVVRRGEAWLQNPDVVANGPLARMIRAVQHARGGAAGWAGADPEMVLAQGRASRQAGVFLAERLIPEMPRVQVPFVTGQGRFLDVGVGVAAISIELCRRYDGLHATGLDVLPEVLELARAEVSAAGLEERVALRELSVADLEDVEEYHLAWVPQPFIPPEPFRAGVPAVHRALRQDGWIVVPLMVNKADSPVVQAIWEHSAHLMGGGPLDVAGAHDLLAEAGFVDLGVHEAATQVCAVGRRP